MAEKILSKEEIDSLLSAMNAGEVDLETSAPDGNVKPYDITARSLSNRHQFDVLEKVFDKFTSRLQKSMLNLLQRDIELQVGSHKKITYSEFIGSYSNPAAFHVFKMDPMVGSAMLTIDADLVFVLIDAMFGGKGRPLEDIRKFTPLEQRILHRVVSLIMDDLREAWKICCEITISLKKTETKPDYLHLANAGDLLLVNVVSFGFGDFTGNAYLCFPHLMLDSIKDKLSSSYQQTRMLGLDFTRQLRLLLEDTPVTLVAELGRVMYSVRDMLNLQKDDVLNLNNGPEDLISIRVGGLVKYLAVPGVLRGNRAVQVKSVLSRKGGRREHDIRN